MDTFTCFTKIKWEPFKTQLIAGTAGVLLYTGNSYRWKVRRNKD